MASFSLETDYIFQYGNSYNFCDDPFVNAGILASLNQNRNNVVLDPHYSDISDDDRTFKMCLLWCPVRTGS